MDGTPDLGVEIIDRIGVAKIAEALGISKPAVRKWRQTGIPRDRQESLHNLLAGVSAEVAPVQETAPGQVAPATRREKPAGKALVALSAKPARLETVTGKQAPHEIKMLIAKRDVDQARAFAEAAAAKAEGLPPVLPVRGYSIRLAMLFALDFPILTMAFVAVTQASPIVAAGSAIALSLFLVLGAHALGGPLRELAMYLPAWLRHLATVIIMLGLLAAVIAVTVDLRIKGFDIDDLLLGAAGDNSIFGDQANGHITLPEPFRWAIARAAGLVTIMATVFGVSWSYQQHAPQTTYARAEAAYRKALRRYAKSVKRLPSRAAGAVVATAFAIIITADSAEAADCAGPSVLAFVDTTTAYDDQDRAVIMPAIETMVAKLEPGDRLVIRTVRDAAASSRLLLDACVPGNGHVEWSLRGIWQWLVTDPNAVRIAHDNFTKGVRDALIPELQGRGDALRTALIGTLAYYASRADQLVAVWLYTDLLESVAITARTLLYSPQSLVAAGPPLPSMSGVDVHVAGFGRFHDKKRRPLTSKELVMLTDSWTALFKAAGGELHFINQ